MMTTISTPPVQPTIEVQRRLITAQRDGFLELAFNYGLSIEALEVQTPMEGFEGEKRQNDEIEAHRDRDTHLNVLNSQIATTGQQINQLQKVVQGGQNPAAPPEAITMGQIAAAKLGQLRVRSDSLTSARDNLATTLGPAALRMLRFDASLGALSAFVRSKRWRSVRVPL